MPIKLPTAKVEASLFSPKVILFYGMPKIGKTEILVMLEEMAIKYMEDRKGQMPSLILEGDPRGAEPYTCTWVQLSEYGEFKDIVNEITKMGMERHEKTGIQPGDPSLFPYRYLAVDTVGTIEDIAVQGLTDEYIKGVRATDPSKRTDTQKAALADPAFKISDLPHGAGHQSIRERVKDMIESLASICHKLIIIAHVKDKEIPDMNNNMVVVTEIALMGKLGSIVASRMDAIGFLSRKGEEPLKVSFLTNGKSTIGTRGFKYLTGKTMEFKWESIFPDEFGLPIPEN